MQTNRPSIVWSGSRAADTPNATGQATAAAVDEEFDDVSEPPKDIADFLGFVVYYLTLAEKEDEVFELVNGKCPNMNGLYVDLCKLFHLVEETTRGGGRDQMHMRVWQSVLQKMRLSASKEDARIIEDIYERFLTCCEGKSWNFQDLQRWSSTTAGSKNMRANLKTLLQRRLLKAGQRLVWKKRKVDRAGDENAEGPEVVGILNEDGKIEFDGATYNSPNGFAGAAYIHLGLGSKAKM